jgi:hypothetical protein
MLIPIAEDMLAVLKLANDSLRYPGIRTRNPSNLAARARQAPTVDL